MKITIQIKNLKDNTSANDFNQLATIESENQYISLSKNNNNWHNSIDLDVIDGKSIFYVKSIKEGTGTIVTSSQNTESQKLNVDFYQTQSQKKENQNKILQLAQNIT